MSLRESLSHWLDVRPGEGRIVILSFLGAFLVISFMILARSLREALFLTNFPVTHLPYITAATAVLTVPLIGLYTRLLGRFRPRVFMRSIVILVAVGLLALWPFATKFRAIIIVFYLWTALSTLLLTTGFWVVTAELFAIRGAKRLFGLIGAGGTLGAVAVGWSLSWITEKIDLIWLIPGLVVLLVIFLGAQLSLPKEGVGSRQQQTAHERTSLLDSFRLVRRTDHLRSIALIIFIATMASALVDYMFKDFAQSSMETKEQLTGFFGAFYGWAGGVALALQIAVVGRIMTRVGPGRGLALLPAVLFLGSFALLLFPVFALAVVVRGGDYSLRKSLLRPIIEFLYVPISPVIRRKTKAFIDTVLDNFAEGLGAALILLTVTLGGLASHYLSVAVILLAGYLLHLCRVMDKQYVKTIASGLRETGQDAREQAAEKGLDRRDLLSGSFTRLDLQTVLDATISGVTTRKESAPSPLPATTVVSPEEKTPVEDGAWEESPIEDLIRYLARDDLRFKAAEALTRLGERAEPAVAKALRSGSTDFVIRRRIPAVMARLGGADADDALLEGLSAGRFEIRYRCAVALVRRRKQRMPESSGPWQDRVWEAIRAELGRDRPVWELQRLLDEHESVEDGIVAERVGARGQLSLEHTFRLLTLVLEPENVRAAFHGMIYEDERLNSFALEYLEQVLPADIRKKLWPFIGDISAHEKKKSARPLNQVVSDLLTSSATLFVSEKDRKALKKMLESDD